MLHYTYSANAGLFNVIRATLKYTGTFDNISPVTIHALQEEALTSFCMHVSEKSLAEVWKEEDDDYWASYLND